MNCSGAAPANEKCTLFNCPHHFFTTLVNLEHVIAVVWMLTVRDASRGWRCRFSRSVVTEVEICVCRNIRLSLLSPLDTQHLFCRAPHSQTHLLQNHFHQFLQQTSVVFHPLSLSRAFTGSGFYLVN